MITNILVSPKQLIHVNFVLEITSTLGTYKLHFLKRKNFTTSNSSFDEDFSSKQNKPKL